MKLAKESSPIEVAEFVMSRNIADEMTFAWWVPYVLRKRNRSISSIYSRVKKATHKLGIDIPKRMEKTFG